MNKYTQRRPHYVDSPGHGLPAIPPHGFHPIFRNGAGAQLARRENGFWATEVAVEIVDANTLGVFYDGVIFTPNTPLAQRTTLLLGDTDGEIVTTQGDPWQALGEVVDDHHTLIRIHQPQGGGVAGDLNYIQLTADDEQLEAGKRYRGTNQQRLLTPVNPQPGDWFVVRNESTIVSGNRISIVGPGFYPVDGAVTAGAEVPPGLEFRAHYNGAQWQVAPEIDMVAGLADSQSGTIARGGVSYEFVSTAPNNTVRLPAVPGGRIQIRLAAGSTQPLTVEQFDAAGVQQMRLEGFTVVPSFTIPVEHLGKAVDVYGYPSVNRWLVYRPWELTGVSDQAEAWQPTTNYVQGDVRSAPEPDAADADFGRVFNWFHLPIGPRTSGATFDLAEKANWQRMAVETDPTNWATVDGDTGAIWLTLYGRPTRLIGASQNLVLPTSGGINLNKDALIRNDSPNDWTVSVSSPNLYEAGDLTTAVPNFTLPAGQTARVVATSTFDAVYNIIGADEGLPIRRYSADGAISDEDQYAIFEAGAVNMTWTATTPNRRMTFYRSAGTAPVQIVHASLEWNVEDPADETATLTTTDRTITVNQPLTVATAIVGGASIDVVTGDTTPVSQAGIAHESNVDAGWEKRGNILECHGRSTIPGGAGNLTVNFPQPFATPPIVVATPSGVTNAVPSWEITPITTTNFQMRIRSTAGGNIWGDFTWFAKGRAAVPAV